MATDAAHKELEWLPNVIKIDAFHPETRPLVYSAAEGEALGAPVFVPRAADSADDDGALLMMQYKKSEPDVSRVLILDAATMKEIANVVLPLPVPAMPGLHNHY